MTEAVKKKKRTHVFEQRGIAEAVHRSKAELYFFEPEKQLLKDGFIRLEYAIEYIKLYELQEGHEQINYANSALVITPERDYLFFFQWRDNLLDWLRAFAPLPAKYIVARLPYSWQEQEEDHDE
jgi:hypothetical protein